MPRFGMCYQNPSGPPTIAGSCHGRTELINGWWVCARCGKRTATRNETIVVPEAPDGQPPPAIEPILDDRRRLLPPFPVGIEGADTAEALAETRQLLADVRDRARAGRGDRR